MTAFDDPSRRPVPGDQARVSVLVEVPPQAAFRTFHEDIDQWWRRGRRYRMAGTRRGIIALEPRVGGRLFESFDTAAGTQVIETGRITAWEPPEGPGSSSAAGRMAFQWRNANFADGESTEVEVLFEPSLSGTLVTVTHRGWSRIRPDHPARHGLEVAPFIRMMGMWWGDLMTALREHARTRKLR
ncbi:MAG TPA: SRPBCC domain-containing protein [Kofleriaceae bacterium]|nr:SRPBCC domain-containing protein [Kofleriaceae bacterium]